MAKVLKYILFLLLVAILHIASDNAFTETNFSEDSIVHTTSLQQQTFDKAQLPYRADAELGSIGFQLSQSFSFRDDRTQWGNYTLKSVARRLAEYQSLLYKHWSKSVDDALLSSITHPVGEYYIFALRHILI